MQASLSATRDSVNWVLTSYIVAAAITLPISGWLAERVGRKRLMLISVTGFTLASLLCATSTNLTQMVVYRALQGVTGAFIVPLAQSTLFDIYPREKHGQAMAMFGGGVMIGPILGPMLGGWLTDNYNWRWVFLVNLPLGAICLFVLATFMPKVAQTKRRFDMLGFGLLAIALGALQLALDRGQQEDWFASWEIIAEAAIALGAAWMFVVHTLYAKDPLFERRMLADRNFATSLIFMTVTGVLLLAGLALLPPLLQGLYGYSVLQSGILTAPRGVGTLVSMLLAGALVGKVDSRVLVGLGVVLLGRVALPDDRICARPTGPSGTGQRRGAGTWPGNDLRPAPESCVRNAVTAPSNHRRVASQPCPQCRRFDWHLGRFDPIGADEPGQPCRPCSANHPANHPHRRPGIAANGGTTCRAAGARDPQW